MKLSDKINNILKEKPGSPTTSSEKSPSKSLSQSPKSKTLQPKSYYSFEYFPPKTEQGLENLIDRIERMAKSNPLWVDITWNAGGVTSDITLELSSHI